VAAFFVVVDNAIDVGIHQKATSQFRASVVVHTRVSDLVLIAGPNGQK